MRVVVSLLAMGVLAACQSGFPGLGTTPAATPRPVARPAPAATSEPASAPDLPAPVASPTPVASPDPAPVPEPAAGPEPLPATEPVAPVAEPDPIPVSALAEPGTGNVSVAFGASVVEQVCVAHRPDFAGSLSALRSIGGFVENSRTSTYYHQQSDLSVKLFSGRCSVVMGGAFDDDDGARIRSMTSAPDAVTTRPPLPSGGKTYFSFSVSGG